MKKLTLIRPIILILMCIILISCNQQEISNNLEVDANIIFTPNTAESSANELEDQELISIFQSIYENGSKINDWRNAVSLDIDYTLIHKVENDINYTEYFKVTTFTNIESVKANCELIFSNDLLTEVVYPILFDGGYPTVIQFENQLTLVAEGGSPTFIEVDEQLYVVSMGSYVTGAGVDYTSAVVTTKNSDSFVIEVPMISLYNPDGDIYKYKVVKQNGYWVLDDHFCFTREF